MSEKKKLTPLQSARKKLPPITSKTKVGDEKMANFNGKDYLFVVVKKNDRRSWKLKREPKKPKECGKGKILKRGRCVKIKKELSDRQKKAIATRKRRLAQLISKAGSAKNSRVGYVWSGMLDGKMQRFKVQSRKIGNKEIKMWVKDTKYCPPGSSRGKSGRCVKDRKLSESARAKKARETRLAKAQLKDDRPAKVGEKVKTVVNGKTIEFVGRKVNNKKTGKSSLRWVRVEKGKKRTKKKMTSVDELTDMFAAMDTSITGKRKKRIKKSSSKKSVKSVPAQPMFGVNPKAVQKGPNAFSAGVGAVPVFGRPMNSQQFLKNTSQTLDQSVMKYNI